MFAFWLLSSARASSGSLRAKFSPKPPNWYPKTGEMDNIKWERTTTIILEGAHDLSRGVESARKCTFRCSQILVFVVCRVVACC